MRRKLNGLWSLCASLRKRQERVVSRLTPSVLSNAGQDQCDDRVREPAITLVAGPAGDGVLPARVHELLIGIEPMNGFNKSLNVHSAFSSVLVENFLRWRSNHSAAIAANVSACESFSAFFRADGSMPSANCLRA